MCDAMVSSTGLSRHNPIDLERILREVSPPPPFPPAADRAAWEKLRDELEPERCAGILAHAQRYARTPVPALPATLYLEYARTGRREGYQDPMRVRRAMLASLALAECLEHEGRYLDPILDVAWAICEESSWSMPAHQTVLADVTHPVIDLAAAATALSLAELDLLLGDELDPALGKRIRDELDRRCFTPYLTRHDHWWLYNTALRNVNNWTAVCTAGVVGAAIYVEPDPARLAEILARAARSLDDYLDTFDPDGGSSEGPGYWSYGFGHYTLLAHLVEHRTDGQVSFFPDDRLRKIAEYPLRTQLSPGRYVPFSDCDPDVRFIPAQLAYLSRRLDIPDLMSLAHDQLRPPAGGEEGNGARSGELPWALRGLFWRVDPAPRFVPRRHDWFSGMAWMLARLDPADPDALTLAVKGGHNAEMHNQNDVGSLVVHLRGESLITDPGRGRYTKAYFGPQRYEHVVNSSRGHSVPLPNGQEQLPGPEHGATVIEHRADDTVDLLALEMRDAYPPEADLESLRRVVTLHREAAGWVELVDEVRFGSGPREFQSALITFGEAEVDGSSVVVRGERADGGQPAALRIGFDPAAVVARVDTIPDVDLSGGRRDLRRIVFSLPTPAESATVRLRIEPL